MPVHALMSLRSRKYGKQWRPVWEFLAREYDVPGPLGLDEAVEKLASDLETDRSLAPGPAAPTVFELIGDAHQIGLRQNHVARLARVVSADDQQRLQLLQHAERHLNWDTGELHAWDEVIATDPIDSDTPRTNLSKTYDPIADDTPPMAPDTPAPPPPAPRVDEPVADAAPSFPELKRAPGMANVSLHQWTTQLSKDGLTAMAPLPDAPACSSTEVTGAGVDGKATTVYGRFEITADVGDLAYATNPLNWPRCSWFFISMTEQGAATSLLPLGSTAYAVDLEELVGMEDLLTVRTGLSTRYFVGNESVGMEFDLTPGTHGDGKIDVDHGYLLAEKHPTEKGKLVITSQKTFSFVGLDDLPFSFLCEFGWIDMMRAMAQCRAPGG